MKNVLVLRLSSMGDVLLTQPVIRGVINSNPDINLIFVTRKKFAPYFEGIDRVTVIPFDPDGKHKKLAGLWRLFLEIRKYRFRVVVDLHGVLRTYLLDALLLLGFRRIYLIRKHRKLRRSILKDKRSGQPVPHTVIRYLQVFERAGIKGIVNLDAVRPVTKAFKPGEATPRSIKIGIAPVSKHKTKNWGRKNFLTLIKLLRDHYSADIHLFGGLENYAVLDGMSGPGVINEAGFIDPMTEIDLIRKMDVFITMDSANMHLASLSGVPTVSIWGATDPMLGFAALNQPDDYALFANSAEVDCRPCSVYGEIPCTRADAPMICMNSVKPEQVFNKICEILG